ncbi:hypothetical protein FG386_002129 [Cryptosporidium ryanae]|uniref:uncharacterized protein n=1 Tax=Cryptosporidium ryanae TaxID=515981 RepID=UPI003519EE0C|nr:hypothetical protein FG386_002129 [Cryptosporidium ryanae]
MAPTKISRDKIEFAFRDAAVGYNNNGQRENWKKDLNLTISKRQLIQFSLPLKFALTCPIYQGNGSTIQTSKIGEIVRRMGLAPSEAEIEQFVAVVGQQCDLAKFVRFCDSIVHPEDTYSNLVQFFKSYDSKSSGSITSQQLTSLLTNSGEVLSEKEIEMLLREFPASDGGFNYEKFLKELRSHKPAPNNDNSNDIKTIYFQVLHVCSYLSNSHAQQSDNIIQFVDILILSFVLVFIWYR